MLKSELKAALDLLESYSCVESKPVSDRTAVCTALKLVVGHSAHQNLGICADDAPAALAALVAYSKAFGYRVQIKPADYQNQCRPVYLKFNGQHNSYYLAEYSGSYRGVLVSCLGSEDDRVNGTFGNFPLGLFEETV